MALEFVKGQHGPKPVTGRFRTREALERAVARQLESGQSQNKIAKDCEVACATVNNIVKGIRQKKLEAEDDLKRAVLRGDWRKIPEVTGVVDDDSGDMGADNVCAGGCDDPHDDGDTCPVPELNGLRGLRESTFDVAIPPPYFKGPKAVVEG